MIRRQLINFQNRSVDVRVGLGAFDELSRMFASAVGKPKRAMVVWNTATSERFGEVVEHALVDAGFAVSLLVLEVSPAGATLADADAIFGALSANGVTCDDLVVAVGDAATCSVVSWCANQWCGRTECALLPTTSASTAGSEAGALDESIMETRLVARSLTPTEAMPSTSDTARETMAVRTSGEMPMPSILISWGMSPPRRFGC